MINHSCRNGFGRFVPSVCPDSVKNPSTLTEEFVRFALVWLAMLASAYVVGKGHLAVTLLSENYKGNKTLLEFIVQLLFLLLQE